MIFLTYTKIIHYSAPEREKKSQGMEKTNMLAVEINMTYFYNCLTVLF